MGFTLKDALKDLETFSQDNEYYLTEALEKAESHRIPMFWNENGPLPLRNLMELLQQYTEEKRQQASYVQSIAHFELVKFVEEPNITKVFWTDYAHG